MIFKKGDKVGFVYNNQLCEGTFLAYQEDDEAIVSYKGKRLIFTECSIYFLIDSKTQRAILKHHAKFSKDWPSPPAI